MGRSIQDIVDSGEVEVIRNEKTGGYFVPSPVSSTSNIHTKASRRYFGDENVKKFHAKLIEHAFSDVYYRWDNVQEIKDSLIEFFELCLETKSQPTLASVSCWLKCNPDLIHNYARTPSSPFCELMQQVKSICQASLENSAIEGKTNPALYIFLGKNYFGMRDNQEITVAPKETTVNNTQTVEAIREQLILEQK